MATRPSVMPGASMPVTTTAMACVRCTSTRWKGCGHYYAPGSALIAASPKRSSPSISASSSSFTTPATAARPCSAPWSPRWSRDHATTLDPDKSLKIYDEVDIVGHVRTVAPVLQNGLRRFADHPLVGEVRGVGLIAAVEIVKDKSTRVQFDPALMMALQFAKRAEAHGLIVRALTGDVIAFSPPMIIETNEIEEMLRALGQALDETWAWVRAQGLS